MITKHSQTKYFVLHPNAVGPTGVGTLYSTATFLPTMPVNALGFYSPVAGSGNHNHSNGAPGTAFKVIQRRDTSGDNSPLYNRPWDDSSWINASCSIGVVMNQVNAALGSNDCHLVGNPAVTADDIVPADLTTFSLQASGHGDRTELYNSNYSTPTTFGTYTTPDFSLGTLTVAQQTDMIVANLAMDFNNKSKDMSFVMALSSAGGAGTGATPILNLSNGTVAVGTEVILGFDSSGNTHSFILTSEMVTSFAALEAALVAAPYSFGAGAVDLVPYVIPGTTGPAAGYVRAGLTNTMDMFAFMALDEGKAMYDYRMATKRRIEIGLTAGLDNVPQVRVATGDEGEGYAHQLQIAYREHNMYEQHHVSRMPYNSYNVEFPNTILADGFYDYFIIEHCDQRTATSGMPTVNFETTVIAVINTTIGDATTNPYFTGHAWAANAVTQRAYLVTALQSFNATNSLGQPTIT